MKDRRKAGRGSFVVSVLGILLCVMMLWGGTGIAAEEAKRDAEQLFDIEARLISLGDLTYDIQLTVGNRGADWEGTVRVDIAQSYNSNDGVYDTVISLPQGSTKQFVVRIPKESIEYTGGTVNVTLLDKKSNKVAQKGFNRFLLDDSDMLHMGILSDSYQSLTYLDMGGEGVYYGGNELPVRLQELDPDSLVSALDSLDFLVIDDFNTGVLTDEAVDHVRQWVRGGGMLVAGTGRRAEDVLCGLDFLELECLQVYEPGESVHSAGLAAGLSQLPLAELEDQLAQYDVNEYSLIMVTPSGSGAIEVTPYALSDLGQPDLVVEDRENYVWELLQNIGNYTRYTSTKSNYGNQRYFDNYYIFTRIFKMLGNGGSRLNLGRLKWIVILYVIFVGPVLYLILRSMNKRDWYWIAVPAATLAGILLVYLAGRGFEVVDTNVYSVTVENLSDPDADAVTYMHCYDAGHKEWGLRLTEGYEYMGPVFDEYYSSNGGGYHNRICREGDRIFFGRNPGAGFEDCYFMAGSTRKKAAGSISGDIEPSAQTGIRGTVTNGTDRDFERFAVIVDRVLYVYGGLPAGETCDLADAEYTSMQSGFDSAMEAYQRGYMSERYFGDDKWKRDVDPVAALGTGVSIASFMEGPNATIFVGLTEDWDKTVDDDCSEISYGCLYSVQ